LTSVLVGGEYPLYFIKQPLLRNIEFEVFS
jgi:hypothetical protein